ncbi:hypothetical protein CH64_2110 [Yersinia rohdei]|uniref:3-phosphoshikimate 1-carboxyvinyltransferase n=1 Tax=Yersinia rohdei TaxID=29485 RepID=A0A0U1HP98_YERRO|nr:hypothetical protein [Yersinia rohdei]AJJ11380.1 hypothetical protein CH64_2110 [Yersinia rohdei]EEQ01185.1 hypothetical protein yrohd0001_16120 [Yersinia rohdei ATCC 43380]MDN0094939.1 hypothetical protein [Yersinia rohdei]OWF82063.1 hypothetical protein B4900_00675 [Yersinia rohdei]CNE59603.1 Uncharacterised protein [Yersinia rohdei]
MTNKQRNPAFIERFYKALDENTNEQLTPEQKQEIEKAIIAITLASKHGVDIRKSFPFFGKHFYLVFLLGWDLRKKSRPASKLTRIMVTFLILFIALFCTFCVLLTLYMIKSFLGIDVFQNFHVGIWDWWLSLKNH